jgi:hypothetical protein
MRHILQRFVGVSAGRIDIPMPKGALHVGNSYSGAKQMCGVRMPQPVGRRRPKPSGVFCPAFRRQAMGCIVKRPANNPVDRLARTQLTI